MTQEEKVEKLLKKLHELYPHPKTALAYGNPLELLIATILSAMATDKLVNSITPTLFARYKTAGDFAAATVDEIDAVITKINFHKTKAKNIHETASKIHTQFHDKVPDSMVELLTLPGVARKTANVVLGNIYHKAEGVVVDTHVARLATKLGLTDKKDPVKIEQDLMKIIPENEWINFSHMLIFYGREHCPARPHECASCPLAAVGLCPDEVTKL